MELDEACAVLYRNVGHAVELDTAIEAVLTHLSYASDPQPGDQIAAYWVRIGDRIQYPPAPLIPSDEIWTVTDNRPDVSRPNSGWRRVVTERINEDGDWVRGYTDCAPDMRFTLISRGVRQGSSEGGESSPRQSL